MPRCEIVYCMLTCRNAPPQSVCFFVNYDGLLAESVLMETAPELFHCKKEQNIMLKFLKCTLEVRLN